MAVMSRASTSLELSEFFNNDDSGGHRLAEFLQKKRGGVQRRNFLFMNCEPMRMSLDVQLEKAPEKKQKIDEQGEQESATEHEDEASKKKDTNPITTSHGESVVTDAIPLPSLSSSEFKDSRTPLSPVPKTGKPNPRLSAVRKSGGISLGDRLRRYSLSKVCARRRTLLQEFDGTISDSGFVPNTCSTPLSQEPTNNIADTPKNDRYENNAKKENAMAQSVLCCGHSETFLKSPPCKDQDLRNMVKSIVETTLKASENKEKENIQRTNKSLENSSGREQSINSSVRKTYTLERGQIPGQVVLTPDVASPTVTNIGLHRNRSRQNDTQSSPISFRKTKNRSCNQSSIRKALHENEHNINKPTTSNRSFVLVERIPQETSPEIKETSKTSLKFKKYQLSPIKQNKTPGSVTPNRSHITIMVESPRVTHSPHCGNSENRAANGTILQEGCRTIITADKSQCGEQITLTPNRIRCTTLPHDVINEVEIPNTQHVNISVAYAAPGEELVLPETQDTETEEKGVMIKSRANTVPIVTDSSHSPANTVVSIGTNLKDNVEIAPAEISMDVNAENSRIGTVEQFVSDEDNLKLTDIMTDDEDPTPKAISTLSMKNNSQAPLNLAASKSNIRTKRLRKRSLSRRRLNMDHSHVMSTEAENDPPPVAHYNNTTSRKRNSKKKLVPLNKAPGTPLNGEKFATELARMSNYEILDLRKRNSMGRIFPISGRKSWWTKEQAMKKQIKLDDEIELELLRRNVEAENDNKLERIETADIVDAEPYPPVPDEFRDTSLPHADLMDSSLVDEMSCDRVSLVTAPKFDFQKPRKFSQRQRGGRKRDMPEVLQHYLDIPKRLSQKVSCQQINSSKRYLYTKGQSDSEENLSSSNEIPTSAKSPKQGLPCVRSPPMSQSDDMPSIRVVSPPPPLSLQTESQGAASEPTVEILPPPPSQFESDSGIESNIVNTECNKSIRNQRDFSVTNVNTDTEDIFKVPLQPPPKTRGRKKKIGSKSKIITSNHEQLQSFDNTDASENGTLRRSKRGHVPLKSTAPLFQMLFQKVLNRNDQLREKKIAKDKKDKKRMRQNIKVNLENISLVSNGNSESSHRKGGPSATVPENGILGDARRLNVQSLVPKSKPKTKSAKVLSKETQNDNSLECSRIKLSTPPPIDHFNSVFDHLRNSGELLSENERPETEMPPKEKLLKVRVARLKKTAIVKGHAKHCSAPTPREEKVSASSNVSHVTQTNSPSVSSTAETSRSNSELISWLKNITGAENSAHSGEIFNEMRISSASNLSFTELQGVEYAFYDTEDKASLGYLRFKPRQIKPKKRAKRYHLHFVTLVGTFRITANDKESIVGPGDMIAIKKSIYYDIENLSDDIGILMVVKK